MSRRLCGFQLEEADVGIVAKLAELLDLPKSTIVRRAIRHYVWLGSWTEGSVAARKKILETPEGTVLTPDKKGVI